MTKDIWRHVTPQFDEYDKQFEQYDSIAPCDFLSIQPRVLSSLQRFSHLTGFAKVLVIHAPDNCVFRHMIRDQLLKLIPQDTPVISCESLAKSAVFTTVKAENGHIVSEVPGGLEQAHGGYLILSPNWLISNPGYWPLLKGALLGEKTSVLNCDERFPILSERHKVYDVKLILVGDREQLADIEYMDEDISNGLSLYTEIEFDLKTSESGLLQYLGYLKWLCQRHHFPALTHDAIQLLLTSGVRFQTEDQLYISLCPFWHQTLLEEAALESNYQLIEACHIQSALDSRYYRESYLPERARDDILNGQVLIETKGHQIGQVNGLTVIDVASHPVSYGEPARISCVVHFGDGDISDVERKVDLGGNLHAKGMMIMQAFVSSALELNAPLPYSASIVFEQSYSEVDGDSASLAEVCSLVSALSNVPINQQIAVTGAVDQFGRVQAVGGLNEKTEGFYQVCLHQGLTGQQGVILPKTNLCNLALHHSVVASIKSGQFHIWPVSAVDEAIPILMGQPFRSKDSHSVIGKIATRIEEFEKSEHPGTFWERVMNKLDLY